MKYYAMRYYKLAMPVLFLVLGGACSPVADLLGIDDDEEGVSTEMQQRAEQNLSVEGTHRITEYPDSTVGTTVTWEIEATNTGDESIEGMALGGCQWRFRFYDPDGDAAEPLFDNFGGGPCLDSYRDIRIDPGETRTDRMTGSVRDILEHSTSGETHPEGAYRVTVALSLEDPAVESPEFELGVVELRR